MSGEMSSDRPDAAEFQRALDGALHAHWRLFLIEGIVLLILGGTAIGVPPVATLAVTIVIGWLFLLSGVMGLIMTFLTRSAPGFWWSLLSAALGIGVGTLLLASPLGGAYSLTIVLVVFFVMEGVASVMFALHHKRELSAQWGWMLASGIVDLVLAAMILAGLPSTATWAIGLLVGINMLFGGLALAIMALHARKAPA